MHKVSIYTVVLLMISTVSMAGDVTCTSGCNFAENPPVCMKGCKFRDPSDYALNGVMIAMQDFEVIRQISAEGVRKTGLGWDADPSWWLKWVQVDNIQQKGTFDKPRLLRTVRGAPYKSTIIIGNCNPYKKIVERDRADRSTEERKSEQEIGVKTTENSKSTISVSASYGDYLNASIGRDVENSIETSRREFASDMYRRERDSNSKDTIELFPFSYLKEVTYRVESVQFFEMDGVVVTDADIIGLSKGVYKIVVGRWSDFAGEEKRKVDVTVEFEIPTFTTSVDPRISEFKDAISCKLALSNEVESE